MTTPRPEESEFSYVDKTSGQLTSFAAKPDEAMVTFAPRARAEIDTLNRIVADPALLSVSQGYDLERGFAAVFVSPARMADVAAQDEVTNSLPVMIDEYGASRYFLPDELTVQFKAGVDPARAEEIIAARGSRVVVRQRTPGYYTVSVPEGRGLFEAIRELSALDEVAFAEPSEVGFNSKLLFVPGDADFGRLWGMRNTGQTVNGVAGAAGADIHACEAWEITRGDPEVIITVIDTGAALTHPDLQANLLPRGAEDWDFGDPNDSVPEDEDGHGSHVSGTCAAVNDAIGVVGVAPFCRVMPLRVDLTTGMNQNRADAINYVAAQANAHAERRYVVNCSWRMNGDHAGVRTAIQNAVAANVVVVFAAGNAGTNTDITPQFPGVYPDVIAVAALDQSDRKATFSNFGTNVDVSAPGVNIWSTFPGGGYAFLDGTSMASPHVAGVAALIWSRNRNLTNLQVRRILESTCDNIDATNTGFVGMLGGGRVNAMSAVTSPLLFATHVEHTADLTGDRRADVVGFGDAGMYVARNQGNGNFDAPQLAIADFGHEAGGWRVERHPRFLADVTGDRRADVVGFGDGGVWVSRNNGNGTFQAPQLVVQNFGYEAGGWRVERHPRFLADLTGDGRVDIVGFGGAGVWVSRNNGNGTFQAPQLVVQNFGYEAGGWRVERHPRFLADLTGDGRADIVGFGHAGVWVSLNNGNGTFQAPKLVVGNFGHGAGGWRVDRHPRFLADVTGDRRADIVGFGDGGVWVSLNNGNGTFQAPQLVVQNFGYEAGGWRVERHPRFLADLTGDGRADIVGFGHAGVWVSLNNGNGTFQAPQLALGNFGYDAGGWRVERHPRFVADLTGDAQADILGFGHAGAWVSLNSGKGAFGNPDLKIGDLGYGAGGWRVHKHPRHVAGPR
ncbi:subtilisin family serine protease [Nonomuraea thailandensis]|uniref:Subtilisin family serine protease n=3 Tax=Nonomuraea thailandensis TaxID=1188745 RepID=A0A9X2GJX2_9ACTN|nr:S8 family serine peptidase [Nonomuraea thailandensis]MCP2360231.1 subtilisin family serine protease [Nonomuraea thailandensis]